MDSSSFPTTSPPPPSRPLPSTTPAPTTSAPAPSRSSLPRRRRPSFAAGLLTNRRRSGRLSGPRTRTPSPPNLSPTRRTPDRPFTLQNRRLQLRNAGFRAPLLQNRKTSPQVAAWRAISSEFAIEAEGNKENDNHNKRVSGLSPDERAHRRRQPTSMLSQNRSPTILQEIGNSTQRYRPRQPRPSVHDIFHQLNDDPEPIPESPDWPPSPSPMEPSNPHTSWWTPSPPNTLPAATAVTPSSSSSFSSSSKKRDDNTGASLRSARYIEHLEKQLASLHNAGSPAAVSNARVGKIKELSAEVKILRQELGEWENKFEARVKEEMQALAERESRLRARARSLERESEVKDNKIREQGWEVEMATQRLRNLEAVMSTNENLERRIDVLTELLAQSPSPTRSDNAVAPAASRRSLDMTTGLAAATDRPSLRPLRPRSMFSKIPVSPSASSPHQRATKRMSGDWSSHDPSSLATSEIKEECDDTAAPASALPSDSGIGDCSLPASLQESKRGSMVSLYSTGSSQLGSSASSDVGLGIRHGNGQRGGKTMRRFPSGVGSLKPLVLPSASGTAGGSAQPSHSRHCSRSSNASPSVDTAISTSSTSTPAPASAPSSAAFYQARNDSLCALEGGGHQYMTFADTIDEDEQLHQFSPRCEPGPSVFDDASPSTAPGYGTHHRRSLHDEMMAQAMPRGSAGAETALKRSPPRLRPRQRTGTGFGADAGTCTGSGGAGLIARDMTPAAHIDRQAALHACDGVDRRLTGNMATASVNVNAFATTTGRDTAALGPVRKASGPLSPSMPLLPRYIALIRRILGNAWHTHWPRLGRLSWWVLGLFFGGPGLGPASSTSMRAGLGRQRGMAGNDERAVPMRRTRTRTGAGVGAQGSPLARTRKNRRRSAMRAFGIVEGTPTAPDSIFDNDDECVSDNENVSDGIMVTADNRGADIYESSSHDGSFQDDLLLDDCYRTSTTSAEGDTDANVVVLPRSVQLWARFSLALLLALGIAVRDGPAKLMMSMGSGECECGCDCEYCGDRSVSAPQRLLQTPESGGKVKVRRGVNLMD